MSLSQAVLDRMAQAAVTMYGSLMESVTYHAKSSPTASVVTSTVSLHLQGYRKHEIDLETILRTDMQARIKTAAITFTPTQYDEFVRADSTRWRVIQPSGGAGQPWWLLQCRQIA